MLVYDGSELTPRPGCARGGVRGARPRRHAVATPRRRRAGRGRRRRRPATRSRPTRRCSATASPPPSTGRAASWPRAGARERRAGAAARALRRRARRRAADEPAARPDRALRRPRAGRLALAGPAPPDARAVRLVDRLLGAHQPLRGRRGQLVLFAGPRPAAAVPRPRGDGRGDRLRRLRRRAHRGRDLRLRALPRALRPRPADRQRGAHRAALGAGGRPGGPPRADARPRRERARGRRTGPRPGAQQRRRSSSGRGAHGRLLPPLFATVAGARPGGGRGDDRARLRLGAAHRARSAPRAAPASRSTSRARPCSRACWRCAGLRRRDDGVLPDAGRPADGAGDPRRALACAAALGLAIRELEQWS